MDPRILSTDCKLDGVDEVEREIIRQGDPTSHGGKVLEGSLTDICHGKPIAYVGHQVSCPKCKGVFPIAEGALTTTFYGKGVALAGMKTACGASLIPTQFTDVVEYGTGTAPAAHSARPRQGAASTSAAATAANADRRAANNDKAIKRIFWTYGSNELPLEGVSRHYVDLNLHVETENYAPGDTVEILVKNEDGSEIARGIQVIAFKTVIGSDGTAKLMNILKNRTVEIGIIG